MIDINKVPFKTLIAAEKTVGKNVFSLIQKEQKTFEDMRDIAFVMRYFKDQSFTLAQANELTMKEIADESGVVVSEALD